MNIWFKNITDKEIKKEPILGIIKKMIDKQGRLIWNIKEPRFNYCSAHGYNDSLIELVETIRKSL